MNIQSLRKSGYIVRVQHVRRFNGIGVLDLNTGEVDTMVTRGEYENNPRSFARYGHQKYPNRYPENVLYSDAVLPTGGFTRVEVTDQNGNVYVAKHNFNNRRFERKIGVASALGKVIKKMKE